MSNEKILIVEDEGSIVQVLRYNLEKAGYRVLSCGDGEAALALARKEHPHAIILDLMIPRLDGLEVCRRLRRDSQVPILMLTAKGEESDRVAGLDCGADDYIRKPFSVAEVLARVRAALRRSGAASSLRRASRDIERIGDLSLDMARAELRLKGRPLALSPREFEFVRALAERDGKVVSREEIATRMRGEAEGRPESEDAAIDALAAQVGRKLEHEGERIVAVPGVGYRLRLA